MRKSFETKILYYFFYVHNMLVLTVELEQCRTQMNIKFGVRTV